MFFKRGFTLVEMLFVVIIAAGALALALPSYKNMRERGKFQAASGMLIDLGSAVEAITRDLAMQGVSVQMGTTYVAVNSTNMSFTPNNTQKKQTLAQVFGGLSGSDMSKILKLLKPFGYLKSFQGHGNFNYYVLTNAGASSTGCEATTISPLTGTLVACMIKPSPASTDCFAGARYYKGGRFETIRMADCKN